MFRSNMNPSKLEWDTLPLNARSGVRRGQMVLLTSESLNFPCGCSGRDSQKPFSSEPAATLSMKLLSGLVIQNDAAVLSEGSRVFLREKLASRMAARSLYPGVSSPLAARFTGTQSSVG